MFVKYNDSSVRLTGRWAKNDNEAVTTACGAKIELSFYGKMAILHFNVENNQHPYPHIWIKVDGGAMTESVLGKYLRIVSDNDTIHNVEIIYKSVVETQHRWYNPLVGKISFVGYEADKAGELCDCERRYIEFVGDSITEGVLIDADYCITGDNDVLNRPFQDDSTATYAYLTAKALKLEPLIMGYGAVGITKIGSGAVPKVTQSYKYCYDGCNVDIPEPEYIVINHGANDNGCDKNAYFAGYEELLDMVRKEHPKARIIVLGAFSGWCHEELDVFVKDYNKSKNANVYYINTYGWISPKPVHPGREGHKIVSQKLINEMKRLNII